VASPLALPAGRGAWAAVPSGAWAALLLDRLRIVASGPSRAEPNRTAISLLDKMLLNTRCWSLISMMDDLDALDPAEAPVTQAGGSS
jgi:hypothetical protein